MKIYAIYDGNCLMIYKKYLDLMERYSDRFSLSV